jgi:hypothetical protein
LIEGSNVGSIAFRDFRGSGDVDTVGIGNDNIANSRRIVQEIVDKTNELYGRDVYKMVEEKNGSFTAQRISKADTEALDHITTMKPQGHTTSSAEDEAYNEEFRHPVGTKETNRYMEAGGVKSLQPSELEGRKIATAIASRQFTEAGLEEGLTDRNGNIRPMSPSLQKSVDYLRANVGEGGTFIGSLGRPSDTGDTLFPNKDVGDSLVLAKSLSDRYYGGKLNELILSIAQDQVTRGFITQEGYDALSSTPITELEDRQGITAEALNSFNKAIQENVVTPETSLPTTAIGSYAPVATLPTTTTPTTPATTALPPSTTLAQPSAITPATTPQAPLSTAQLPAGSEGYTIDPESGGVEYYAPYSLSQSPYPSIPSPASSSALPSSASLASASPSPYSTPSPYQSLYPSLYPSSYASPSPSPSYSPSPSPYPSTSAYPSLYPSQYPSLYPSLYQSSYPYPYYYNRQGKKGTTMPPPLALGRGVPVQAAGAQSTAQGPQAYNINSDLYSAFFPAEAARIGETQLVENPVLGRGIGIRSVQNPNLSLATKRALQLQKQQGSVPLEQALA